MIANLFSSFDPSSFTGTLNWLSLLRPVLITGAGLLLIKSPAKKMFFLISHSFIKESSMIIKESKRFRIAVTSLFILIIVNNFLGLFPYVFTSTRHMSITLVISSVIWLRLIIFGWVWKNKEMFAHLVPISTPGLLMPFMVVIETVRRIIRPLTLAIRLSANIIAGHLLMTLLGNQLASFRMMPIIIPAEFLLVSLEIAVSLIQGYVFATLITLYIREIREAH
jgi:F-type H+-transporting ATPase subunit a